VFPDPVALRICRESRIYTLNKYTALQHFKLPMAFYMIVSGLIMTPV